MSHPAALAATAMLLAGCETAGSKRKKAVATIHLHIEAGRDDGDRIVPVTETVDEAIAAVAHGS